MSATIGTLLNTWLTGRLIGTDEFGNRYYEARREPAAGHRTRRWVLYRGAPEPSKIPAAWHGWLHHTLERPMVEASRKYGWQKEHLPNLTGTVLRYVPAGHITKGGNRAHNTADYEPWKPN